MGHTVANVQHYAGHQTLRIERKKRLDCDVGSVEIVLLEHGLVYSLSIL